MRFMLDGRRQRPPTGAWWKGRTGASLFASYLRGPGHKYLSNRIVPVADWAAGSNIATAAFRFEDVMGDAGLRAQRRCVERVCERAKLSRPQDPVSVLRAEVLGKPTRTYSGHRSPGQGMTSVAQRYLGCFRSSESTL